MEKRIFRTVLPASLYLGSCSLGGISLAGGRNCWRHRHRSRTPQGMRYSIAAAQNSLRTSSPLPLHGVGSLGETTKCRLRLSQWRERVRKIAPARHRKSPRVAILWERTTTRSCNSPRLAPWILPSGRVLGGLEIKNQPKNKYLRRVSLGSQKKVPLYLTHFMFRATLSSLLCQTSMQSATATIPILCSKLRRVAQTNERPWVRKMFIL